MLLEQAENQQQASPERLLEEQELQGNNYTTHSCHSKTRAYAR
jgi:hypothetical protein